MRGSVLVAAVVLVLSVSAPGAAASSGGSPSSGSAVGSSTGSTAVDVVAGARPEEGQIHRLYRSVLGRAPDSPGFDYWVAARVEGLPLRAVADGFLNSGEYALRFGAGSDTEFLDRVYGNVLGRPGDAAGVDYWLGEMAGGLPRTELVLLFSESPENRNRTGTTLVELPHYRPLISQVTASDVALSWRPGCPVGPEDLRAVEVDHVDFEGDHRRGTLIVNAPIAAEVADIFERLYEARYPIASLVPVEAFAADDDASMAANNTSAYNCRLVTNGTSWSRHSYGTAIDINPVQNPYVTELLVLPPSGADYMDRATYHQAMIRPGDVVTSAFAAAGWRWGGEFRTLKDYQHFDR